MEAIDGLKIKVVVMQLVCLAINVLIVRFYLKSRLSPAKNKRGTRKQFNQK